MEPHRECERVIVRLTRRILDLHLISIDVDHDRLEPTRAESRSARSRGSRAEAESGEEGILVAADGSMHEHADLLVNDVRSRLAARAAVVAEAALMLQAGFREQANRCQSWSHRLIERCNSARARVTHESRLMYPFVPFIGESIEMHE